MDAKGRQKRLVGALLTVAVAAVVVSQWGGTAGPPATKGRAGARAATVGRKAPAAAAEVADVRLGELAGSRPAPETGGRNPFTFQPKAPPPPPPDTRPPRTGTPAETQSPAAPPPIPLRFIGVVDAPARIGRLAVLSDGRNVFHGREGEVIDGRYRILKIGAESIEMAYLDGRGRQLIRLSGG